jgi:hypothetical protein
LDPWNFCFLVFLSFVSIMFATCKFFLVFYFLFCFWWDSDVRT